MCVGPSALVHGPSYSGRDHLADPGSIRLGQARRYLPGIRDTEMMSRGTNLSRIKIRKDDRSRSYTRPFQYTSEMRDRLIRCQTQGLTSQTGVRLNFRAA